MELSKEEMLERLRSVEEEKKQYVEVNRKINEINFLNGSAFEEAQNKEIDGPGFFTNILAVVVGFFMWLAYYIISFLILGNASGLFVCFILGVITGFLFRHFVHKKSVEHSLKQMYSDDDPEVQQVQARKEAVVKALHDKIGFLDEDYCYPWAIEDLERIFRTGRADTLKEGLRELEEDIHRDKMENKYK